MERWGEQPCPARPALEERSKASTIATRVGDDIDELKEHEPENLRARWERNTSRKAACRPMLYEPLASTVSGL